MSCGDPHEMDCADVVAQCYEYLDKELLDDDSDGVRRHLEECAPCLRAYGLEEHFKQVFARKCGCETAPEELRHRLLVKLQAVTIETMHVEYRSD